MHYHSKSNSKSRKNGCAGWHPARMCESILVQESFGCRRQNNSTCKILSAHYQINEFLLAVHISKRFAFRSLCFQAVAKPSRQLQPKQVKQNEENGIVRILNSENCNSWAMRCLLVLFVQETRLQFRFLWAKWKKKAVSANVCFE